MKAFAYSAPGSLPEAIALIAEEGSKARLLAGGTDVIVQMRAGRYSPTLLVDVKRIAELNELAYDPSRGLTVGAAVPCYRIYEDPTVRVTYPALVDSVSIIGGVAIQGRATVGGNLCNASPSGDSIPSLIVLGAHANIAGPGGTRSVPAEQFCVAPGRSVLQPGEILVSITVPPPRPNSGAHYLRFIPRNEMDIAVVGAGAWVVLGEDQGRFQQARIALGAVAPTPLLVESAGDALAGQPVSDDAIRRAAALAREAARPIGDMRGTVEQRRHLVGVLTERALRGAIKRARGESIYGH